MDAMEQSMPLTVALMRELMGVIRVERGEVGTAIADQAQDEYRHDGVGVPVMMLCDFIIEDDVPLPSSVVGLYREVGETEMSWDPEFMDDYFQDLERLIA